MKRKLLLIRSGYLALFREQGQVIGNRKKKNYRDIVHAFFSLSPMRCHL